MRRWRSLTAGGMLVLGILSGASGVREAPPYGRGARARSSGAAILPGSRRR